MDEPPKTPPDLVPKPTAKEITLTDLMRYGEPLFKEWIDSDNEKHKRTVDSENEKHKRELEYTNNLLQTKERQESRFTNGVFVISVLFIVIIGLLFRWGRDSSAMDLIKLIVGLGTAAFGGYGLAMARRRTEEEEL